MPVFVQKSRLFKEQALNQTEYYQQQAGSIIAERFIEALEKAIAHIAHLPLSCVVYCEAAQHPLLQQHEFRQCSLRKFPQLILYRLSDKDTVLLEALYGYKMHVIQHLASDWPDLSIN
jgi:hypothetical protein